MLIIFLPVENNVCWLSPLLFQDDSLICWCRLRAGRLGGGFDSVGRLSLWQACCKGSAPRKNPSSLEIAGAVSHFLLMRSYIAGGVQINLMEVEKLYRNGVSRVVFYILLSRLILVTMWNSRSNSGMRSHLAWGKHTFGLPRSLLASWEAQGIRLTSWFVDAVVWSRRKSGTERAGTSIRGNLCNVVGTGMGSIL